MALPSRRHDREKASESEGRSLLSRNTNEIRTIVSYYYIFMVWLLLLFHRVPQVMEDDGSSVRETGVTETKSKEFHWICLLVG